jgi:hypothetical protein
MTKKEKIIVSYHVADLYVDVSAVPEGDFSMWPKNIQDGVYKAIETHSKRTGRPYEISYAKADRDYDTGPYIHVVARAPKYYEDLIQ